MEQELVAADRHRLGAHQFFADAALLVGNDRLQKFPAIALLPREIDAHAGGLLAEIHVESMGAELGGGVLCAHRGRARRDNDTCLQKRAAVDLVVMIVCRFR